MPRDTRPYITVHDGMPDHPKIDPLSDAAFRLLVGLWCWCSRHRTNGKVPLATWTKRGTVKARSELLAQGLAVESSGGIEMHDYLEHQRSGEQIDELSRKRAEAGQKGGKARASTQASAKQVLEQPGSKLQADTEGLLRNPQTETSSSETDVSTRPEIEHLCRLLADLVEANGARRPTVAGKWRTEARLLLDRDGVDPDEAERVLRWSQADSFWRTNVLSMPKFREKYDQLALKSREQRGGRNGERVDRQALQLDPGDEWMRDA